jgi:hypothetical protein
MQCARSRAVYGACILNALGCMARFIGTDGSTIIIRAARNVADPQISQRLTAAPPAPKRACMPSYVAQGRRLSVGASRCPEFRVLARVRSKNDLRSGSSRWRQARLIARAHVAFHCMQPTRSSHTRLACAVGIANVNLKATRVLRSHKDRQTASPNIALVRAAHGKNKTGDVMRSQPYKAIRLHVQRRCKRCNRR